jgi:hypothetical protein
MPIVTRQRRFLSYIIDALIAPFALVLAAVFPGWWIFLVMAFCLAICFVLGDLGAAPDWNYRETLIILAGVYFGIFFAALLLSVGEYLFTDRREQVWIPDRRCIDISRSVAERLITRDFRGLFDFLSREFQARLTIDDLTTAFDDQCRRYGIPEAVGDVRELQPASCRPNVCAVTQVTLTCGHSEKPAGDKFTLTLRMLLSSVEEQYQVVALEYLLPCPAFDSDDFGAIAFNYVPQATVFPLSSNFVFSRGKVAVTRRMIRHALVQGHQHEPDQFNFLTFSTAGEMDAEDWDGFWIRERASGDWAIIRRHPRPIAAALLARLAQEWHAEDSMMNRVREEDFDQAFEIDSPYTGHTGLGDVVCHCFIERWQAVAVFPSDELVLDPVT